MEKKIDIEMLKETVVTKNTTFEALAYAMGINRSTLYRKLRRGTSGITLRDAEKISNCLALSRAEASRIFGGAYVPPM